MESFSLAHNIASSDADSQLQSVASPVAGGVAHREAQASQGLSNVPYFPAVKSSPSSFRPSRSARSAESITLNLYPGMMEVAVKLPPQEPDFVPESLPAAGGASEPSAAAPAAPKRGAVRGFSPKSRNNLRKFMNKVTGLDQAVFVTLTYPNEFPASSLRWKRDVKVFKARFEREYLGAGGLWRMELKQRKSGSNRGMVAPHFHLLVVGIEDLQAFRDWLSLAWFEVVGSDDLKHLRAGTNAVRVQNARHAMFYVSKYISKNEDDLLLDETGSPVSVGRFWGKLGNIDTLPVFSIRVNYRQLVELRRVAAGWLKAADRQRFARIIKRGKLGFSMFGWGVDDPDVVEGSIGGQALRCIGFDDLMLFAATLGAVVSR